MKKIKISYTQTTPESVEEGDFSETGWIDETGVSMEPDKYDLEEGLTAVDLAVDFLKREGAIHFSSEPFFEGGWYSTEFQTVDYRDGTQEEQSFHLEGFTPEEEEEIYNKLFKKGSSVKANAEVELINFLDEVLTPDLLNSGHEELAKDSDALSKFLAGAKKYGSYTAKTFKMYLKVALIPDLESEGQEGMAETFKEGLALLSKELAKKEEEEGISISSALDKALKEKLIEAIAAIEHDAWRSWAASVAEEISAERKAKFQEGMVPYDQLDESTKDIARKWATDMVDAIEPILSETGGKVKEMITKVEVDSKQASVQYTNHEV